MDLKINRPEMSLKLLGKNGNQPLRLGAGCGGNSLRAKQPSYNGESERVPYRGAHKKEVT